jgi:hypothetical protein
MDGQASIAALIGAAVTEHTEDRSALLRLSAATWPGRDDRTVPVGRDWIRAWGPRPIPPVPQGFSDN